MGYKMKNHCPYKVKTPSEKRIERFEQVTPKLLRSGVINAPDAFFGNECTKALETLIHSFIIDEAKHFSLDI